MFGQELTPVFENITDGLPSTEVHDMFQDSLGYMWFATDRGICRYNGIDFKKIETSQYLKTDVVFKFFKQSEMCVWIVTGNGRLFYFNPYESNLKFTAHEKNSELLSLKNYSAFSLCISEMKFDSKNIKLFSRMFAGYVSLTKDKVEFLNQSKENLLMYSFDIEIDLINNHYYTVVKEKNTSQNTYIKFNGARIVVNPEGIVTKYFDYGISSFLDDSAVQLFSIGKKLIRHDNGEITHIDLPKRILSIVSIGNKYFIGTYNGIYGLNNNLDILNHLLKGEIITKLYKDDLQMLWVGTIQNGIYLCIDLAINEVLFSNKRMITEVLKSNSFIGLYSNINEDVIYLDSNLQPSNVFDGVYENHFSVKSKKNDLFKFLGKKRQYKSPSKDRYKAKYLLETYDNFDFVLAQNILYKKNGQELIPHYTFDEELLIKFSCQIESTTLALGSKEGLFFFNTENKSYYKHHSKSTEEVEFNAFTSFENQALLASRKGVFSIKNQQVEQLLNSKDVDVKGFSSVEKGLVYAYSDQNVFKIYEKRGVLIFEKIDIRVSNSDLFILSVEVYNNQLWIATKKGLFITVLKPDKQRHLKSFFSFQLDSIVVDKNVISSNQLLELKSGNELKIYFDIVSFSSQNSRILEYSLHPGVWHEMNKSNLTLADLPSGDYLLKIRRIDDPNKILFQLPICVLKPFYKRGWFNLLVFALLVFLIYFVVKVQERKNKRELEKLNLELKLLTSKMNPHFTFNTINSIQHSIMKSDRRSAIQYLSEFALLMRKSLDFSMAERIFLSDEKEFLELYVKMENKRFDSNFILKFEVESDELLRTKKIPSMLIQPLVENIILHADYSDHEEKIILVKIALVNNYFLISVVDYGNGIKEDKEGLSKHKSYGLEILRSRVKMYNAKGYKETDVSISRTNEKENKGTTVLIKLKEWTQ